MGSFHLIMPRGLGCRPRVHGDGCRRPTAPHTGWQTGRMPEATPFDPDRIGTDLPAAALIENVRRLAATGPGLRAVVEAPPGTGKTTVIPPALQQALTSAATSHPAAEAAARPARVLVSQPRRVAARAAAARLASLSGLRVG